MFIKRCGRFFKASFPRWSARRPTQYLKIVSPSSGIEACEVAIVVQELLVTMGRHVLRYDYYRVKDCEMENTQSTLNMLPGEGACKPRSALPQSPPTAALRRGSTP